MRILTFILLAAASLCGCDGPPCYKTACISGISVRFTGPDGEPLFDAIGSLTVDGEEKAFDCTGETRPSRCVEGYVFVSIGDAETAQVTVTADDGELEMSGDLTLDYEDQYSHGEDCGPVCQTSTHEVMLEDSLFDD